MLRKRKNSPFWYVILWMDGKKVAISTRETSKRKAKAIEATRRKNYQERRRQEQVAIILGEKPRKHKHLLLSEAWAKYRHLNPEWAEGGLKIFQVFKRWAKDDIDIAEVDTDMALQFLDQYRTSAVKTFNTYKSSLHRIWHVLKPFTDIQEIPWSRIPNRTGSSDLYRPFTEAEYKDILGSTTGWWHDATVIAWHTGLRRGDIMQLKWEKIKDNAIEFIPGKTRKNMKEIYVPLAPEVLEVLSRHKNKSPYVFPSEAKKGESGAFERQFMTVLKNLNISARPGELVGFRSLRSAFITRMTEGGIHLDVLQGIVGHGSPMMTRHYSHDKKSARKILKVK
jgi:integrase